MPGIPLYELLCLFVAKDDILGPLPPNPNTQVEVKLWPSNS